MEHSIFHRMKIVRSIARMKKHSLFVLYNTLSVKKIQFNRTKINKFRPTLINLCTSYSLDIMHAALNAD